MSHSAILKSLCLLAAIVMIGPMLVGQASSGKTLDDPVAPAAKYNLYFGDLHGHTGYSDAYEDSTPWDAYAAAIAGGADFMALTDHNAVWHGYEAWILDEEEWQDTLDAVDHFTSDEFVAMAGYEAWLLGMCGEINVYNVRELPTWKPVGGKFDRLPTIYDWLASQPGAIGQFNHPLYVSNNFLGFEGWTEARDAAMGIVEVYNDEFTEDSYIMALDAGWHLMPSANADTHYSDWIAGHEMRTVLLAPSLTPENLYAAMRAGNGYGTLDKNLEVRYTLDGAIMGSTLSDPDGEYTASIQVFDPDGMRDEITLVEIVSDGGEVVWSAPTSGTSVDLTVELDSEDARYFYVRVTTASPLESEPGVTAWTAPVWTGN